MAQATNITAAAQNVKRVQNANVIYVNPYNRNRAPTTADIKDPATGRYYEIHTEWRDTTTDDIWKLVDIANNLANWILLTSSLGTIVKFTPDDTNVVTPIVGNVDVIGLTVANATNAKPIFTSRGGALNDLQIEAQVATARTGAPADNLDAGLCSFDDTVFSVDAFGYVTLVGGGAAVDSFDIDFNTAPGTDPVVPDGSGVVGVFGNVVANATNANSPVATHSRAANQYDIDVQLATAVAPTPADVFDVGLCSFDSNWFTVSAFGFVSLADPIIPPSGILNLGFDYAAGVFQIVASDGSALSATNKGYVKLQSKADPGENLVVELVNPYQFQDDAGTSDIAGWYPGMNSGDDWNEDKPFFVYVIAHDTPTSDPAVAISLNPCRTKAPAAAAINTSASITSQVQDSFFLLDIDTGGGFAAPTIGDYDANPCLCIGAFRMQITNVGTNDWTVQTLSTNDGVGNFLESVKFLYPTGVQGSISGGYFQATTGTAPIFSFNKIFYILRRNGNLFYNFNCLTISNVPAGAGQARPSCPYQGVQDSMIQWMKYSNAGTIYAAFCPFLDSQNYFGNAGGLGIEVTNTVGTELTNADFVDGGLQFYAEIPAFLPE